MSQPLSLTPHASLSAGCCVADSHLIFLLLLPNRLAVSTSFILLLQFLYLIPHIPVETMTGRPVAGRQNPPPSGGMPPRQEQSQPTYTTRQNEYFVPRDGIDREVITADICRYLGNDALVRPGVYEVPN